MRLWLRMLAIMVMALLVRDMHCLAACLGSCAAHCSSHCRHEGGSHEQSSAGKCPYRHVLMQVPSQRQSHPLLTHSYTGVLHRTPADLLADGGAPANTAASPSPPHRSPHGFAILRI
ncbi:MAG: hypothetical protein ABSH32_16400 [Bryobacteraceae bacterium]